MNKTYHLYLVRHGESIQNTHENHDKLPDHAIPLTDKGKRQASDAGQFLGGHFYGEDARFYRVWASPYTRTRQTAWKVIDAIRGVETRNTADGSSWRIQGDYREDDMLTELQFGLFNNIPKSELAEKFPNEYASFQNDRTCKGKFFARRPGGESPFDCTIRQKLFLDTLYRDFQKENCPEHIIIVGHGAALNVLRKCIFHYSYEWYEDVPNPDNCSIQHIVLNTEGENKDIGYIYGRSQPEK